MATRFIPQWVGSNGFATIVDRTAAGTTPTKVQSASSKVASGNIVCTLGSTPTVGNLLVLVMNGTGTAPTSGMDAWIPIYSNTSVGSSGWGAYIYIRKVQTGDGTTWTFTPPAYPMGAVLIEFSGARTDSIGAVASSGAGSGTTTQSENTQVEGNAYGFQVAGQFNSLSLVSVTGAGASVIADMSGGGGRSAVAFSFTSSATATITWSGNTNGSGYVQIYVWPSGGVADAGIRMFSSGTSAAKTVPTLRDFTYIEFDIGSGGTGTPRVGISTLRAALSGISLTSQLGADNYGIGYAAGGTVVRNLSTITTLASYTYGDQVGMAVRNDVQKVWFRKITGGTPGGWNNDVIGNQDPANNIGGIDWSVLTNPELGVSPTVSCDNAIQIYLRKSSGEWVGSAPSGAVGVDAAAIVTSRGMTNDVYGFSRGPFLASPIDYKTSGYWMQTWNGNIADQISGIVTELGIPVSKIVRLYDYASGRLLDQTTSNATSGAFTLQARGSTNVYCVAFDPTTYQAIVYDQLIPIGSSVVLREDGSRVLMEDGTSRVLMEF